MVRGIRTDLRCSRLEVWELYLIADWCAQVRQSVVSTAQSDVVVDDDMTCEASHGTRRRIL